MPSNTINAEEVNVNQSLWNSAFAPEPNTTSPLFFNTAAVQAANAAALQQAQQAFNSQSMVEKKKGIKKAPEPSQTIYTLQIPEALLESSLASINQELEERANALSEISTLLEVVQETDILIRHHLSILQRASTLSERTKSKVTQSYLNQFGQVQAEGSSSPLGASPAAASEEW
jgi:hypothetical protein